MHRGFSIASGPLALRNPSHLSLVSGALLFIGYATHIGYASPPPVSVRFYPGDLGRTSAYIPKYANSFPDYYNQLKTSSPLSYLHYNTDCSIKIPTLLNAAV